MSAPALKANIQGLGAVDADNLNTYAQWCVNVAQLRTFIGLPSMLVYAQGTNTPGDGGQGFFYWAALVTEPDDGQNFIIPAGASGGGWIRIQNITPTVDITNSDDTLTLTPNPITGSGTISLNLNKANIWSVPQSATAWELTGGGLWDNTGLTIADGPITPVSTSGIVGTTTNDNAAAGSWGEYKETVVLQGSAVALSSGGTENIVTLALTAGDWDCSGVATITNGMGTATAFGCFTSLSMTSVTQGTLGQVNVASQLTSLDLTASFPPVLFMGPYRVSIAAPGTLHLVISSNFSGGTAAGYGQLRARRVR